MYRIPDDVIRKLGAGDNARGLAALCDTFGIHGVRPVGAIPADMVKEIGGGNLLAGRKVLNRFCQRIRQSKKPATGVIIKGSHTDIAISVDRS